MTIVLKLYDGLNHTPALPLIAFAWSELIANRFDTKELMGSWDHQAIVAFHNDEPIGLITWTHEKWRKMVWLHLGFVRVSYRRQGVYRTLWERLVIESQKLEALEIQGGIHALNNHMRACANHLGRSEFAVMTRYVVPPAAKQEITPDAARQSEIEPSAYGQPVTNSAAWDNTTGTTLAGKPFTTKMTGDSK